MINKKIISLFFMVLFVSLTFTSFVCASEENENISTCNYYPNQGPFYECTLLTNPSTGYYWVPNYNSDEFEYLGSNFISDNSNITGAPGKETFLFKPLKSNVSDTMEFDLISPSGDIINHITVNLKQCDWMYL